MIHRLEPADRVKLIETRLKQSLDVQQLLIIDDSAKHAGHAGAKERGGGHFTIKIVSEQFQNKSAVQRHRMIYSALGDAMETEIHALSIKALTPDEDR